MAKVSRPRPPSASVVRKPNATAATVAHRIWRGKSNMREAVGRLTAAEVTCIVFATVFVNLCYYRIVKFGASCCDAGNYRSLADLIVRSGLFSAEAFSPTRTYGYPLFLSVLQRTAGLFRVSL